MRLAMLLLTATLLAGCEEQSAPWGTEAACQAAADAVCSRRVECGAPDAYELCYGRILRDCKLGLDGLHSDDVVMECIDATQGVCSDHVPYACLDWWCTDGAGQDYCP